jgi:DNA-binding CsgD family transcriptional regulator
MLTLESGLAMWHGEYAAALEAALAALSVEDTEDVWLLAPVMWHAFRAAAEARANGRRFDAATESRLHDLDVSFAQSDQVAHGPVHEAIVAYEALWRAEAVRHAPREAASAWARAEELWHRRGQPYPTLYARVRGVEAALAGNRRSARAQRTLRECLDGARSLGAEPLVNEIVGLAHRAGVPLEAADRPEPDAEPAATTSEQQPLDRLTARELEVLQLLAAGCRDREIASKLFVSPRTVSTHVSHILRRLDVSSRLQAANVYLAAERSGPARDHRDGTGHLA